MDVEELLERTWTPAMAERIAAAVAGPGNRGSIVRGVQPGAGDDIQLFVFEEVADELARQTGVDVDYSRTASSRKAISDVLAVLTARWQDGGPLPAVPPALEQTARRHMAQLTLKAAEWAGCDAEGDPPAPLHAGGCIRVDVEGLHRYLATFGPDGVTGQERAAITALTAMPLGEPGPPPPAQPQR